MMRSLRKTTVCPTRMTYVKQTRCHLHQCLDLTLFPSRRQIPGLPLDLIARLWRLNYQNHRDGPYLHPLTLVSQRREKSRRL